MDEGIRRSAAQRDRTGTQRVAALILPERPHRIALWTGFLAIVAMLAVAATAHAGSGGVGTDPGGGGGTGTGGGSVNSSRYTALWNGFTAKDQSWAHKVSDCESGGDPRAVGGGGRYRGAFQFTIPTWKASPKSPGGDPIRYTWRTQAVVAVLLKHRAGSSPWPVCGHSKSAKARARTARELARR